MTKQSEIYGIAIITIKLVHVHHLVLKHNSKDLDQMTDKRSLLFALNVCKWKKTIQNYIFFSIFRKKHTFLTMLIN